jgi:hypothetical protein
MAQITHTPVAGQSMLIALARAWRQTRAICCTQRTELAPNNDDNPFRSRCANRSRSEIASNWLAHSNQRPCSRTTCARFSAHSSSGRCQKSHSTQMSCLASRVEKINAHHSHCVVLSETPRRLPPRVKIMERDDSNVLYAGCVFIFSPSVVCTPSLRINRKV